MNFEALLSTVDMLLKICKSKQLETLFQHSNENLYLLKDANITTWTNKLSIYKAAINFIHYFF